MKKFFLTILLLSSVLLSRAQSRTVELYYIAHDDDGTVLSGLIDAVHSFVRNDQDRKVLFYLSIGSNPKFVLASRDDSKEFASFIKELTSGSTHPVSPKLDMGNMLAILSSGNMLPAGGLQDLDKLVLNFFISRNFVARGYGDEIIGRLFWDMELSQIPDGKLEINILHPKKETLDAAALFGSANLINQFPVTLNEY